MTPSRYVLIAAGLLLSFAVGCATSPERHAVVQRTYVLSAETAAAAPAATRPATPSREPATQPAAGAASQPVTTAPRRTYTAPGAAARQLSLVPMAIVAGTVGQVSDNARDASEAAVGALSSGGRLGGIIGAPSLGAAQAITLNAIPSQPGIRGGFPAGFGPVPAANLFTRQLRPLSGPNGSCNALVRAGFFGDSESCLRHFRR